MLAHLPASSVDEGDLRGAPRGAGQVPGDRHPGGKEGLRRGTEGLQGRLHTKQERRRRRRCPAVDRRRRRRRHPGGNEGHPERAVHDAQVGAKMRQGSPVVPAPTDHVAQRSPGIPEDARPRLEPQVLAGEGLVDRTPQGDMTCDGHPAIRVLDCLLGEPRRRQQRGALDPSTLHGAEQPPRHHRQDLLTTGPGHPRHGTTPAEDRAGSAGASDHGPALRGSPTLQPRICCAKGPPGVDLSHALSPSCVPCPRSWPSPRVLHGRRERYGERPDLRGGLRWGRGQRRGGREHRREQQRRGGPGRRC